MAGHQPAQRLELDVSGVRTLVLRATGYSWGQAVWGEPVLLGAGGETQRLANLTPVLVQVGWGEFSTNRGPDGQPLKVGERAFADGLFAHADSVVKYRLEGKQRRFASWVGVNHTAKGQGRVVFEALDEEAFERQQRLAQLKRGFTRDALSSLRRTLDDAPARGGDDRRRELRRRLDSFSRDYQEMRRRLEAEDQDLGGRIDEFLELTREIRLLRLDAPLLFVKRQPYFSAHIYDDHLEWRPGGGIYVIENPWEPMERQRVRAVIDPATPETCGPGVYRDPDLSFDGRRLLFAFKGEAKGDTAIFEIGLDGRGLRRLTRPTAGALCRERPEGLIGEGHHDYSPCHLPDGRIAFVSTRTAGLVMCFNNHVATLHTMNADGSEARSISVNNATEFDPAVLPDGRLLLGRWEYVDKTALYMQSLWTMNPDGTLETAFFKNNLAKPTAVMDARPVPGSRLVVATLTPHNGQSVGAIAMIDPHLGKNSLAALANFTPEYPTEMDQGLKRGPCDPWPLDEDSVLIANNAEAHGPHGVIELIDRYGFRFVIRREPDLSCFSPLPAKAQPRPLTHASALAAGAPALFQAHDIYPGLERVKRGTVKRLRVIETTSRITGAPPGGRWWNQAFLVSWQGSYDVKNILGTVPVEEDGSAFFEAPPGKALYFQALDAEGRLVQSMRTFIQAAPGRMRPCQGCHVPNDDVAALNTTRVVSALRKPPAQLRPETWGSGPIDYSTRIQPVLDRHCVRCHGGIEDIAGGIDLSGGWTWAFNLSYETLLKNTLTGFLNCENSKVETAEILPPRRHGSGAAPLAGLLLSGHKERLPGLTRPERDLLLAWMDANCNYYGAWDFTDFATNGAIMRLTGPLLARMDQAGCLRCHEREIGSDWVNLQTPAHSRLLRAPLPRGPAGAGLGWCRERKARPAPLPLITQKHQPPDVFKPARHAAPDAAGAPAVSLDSTNHADYRALLALIERARAEALDQPRADMPGAILRAGRSRELPPLTPVSQGEIRASAKPPPKL